jgi:hypothetical protein
MKRARKRKAPASFRAGSRLAHRVPSPPPRFAGREAEIRRIKEAALRGPLTLLHGGGGLGKSALAFYVLHKKFSAEAASAVFVSLRDTDPHEHVALTVIRALVCADNIKSFDWSELFSSPDALAAVAVNLAEASRRWVVLDDLHCADPERAQSLLHAAARGARASKWIAISRAAPLAPWPGVASASDGANGQIIELSPMSEADLERLALALHPSPRAGESRDARDAAARAAGSPWRLRQIAAECAPARAPESLEPMSDLASDTLAFLQALWILQTPLPEAVLLRIAPPPAEGVDALERRGLVERSGEGVRLHAIAGDLLPRPADTDAWRAWRARAAEELARVGEARATLRAIRFHAEAGRLDAIGQILSAAGEGLLAEGYAASLWGILERATRAAPAGHAGHPGVEAFRLRCAVEIGDADILSAAPPPSDSAPETRLLWARLLLARGRILDAIPVAQEVAEDARRAGNEDLAFRAGLLHARCKANSGDLHEAIAILDELNTKWAVEAAERDALLAMALALSDQPALRERAVERAAALRQRIPELPWPARGRIGYGVSRAYSFLGRLRESTQALDSALQAGRDGAARLDVGRGIRYARMCLAVDAGDLERARVELEHLDPFVPRASLLRLFMINAKIHVHMAAGELDEIDRLLPELLAADPPAPLRDEVQATALRLRILKREATVEAEGAVGDTIFGKAHALYSLEKHLRQSGAPPEPLPEVLAETIEQPELRVIVKMVRAQMKLCAGDAAGALAEITAAVADAADQGLGVREAEARELACDLLWYLGEREALEEAAAALGSIAGALPSPRFLAAHRLYRAVASRGPLDAALLETLAGAQATAPAIAIRARALLGDPPEGDALDQRIIGAALRRGDLRLPARVLPASAPRGAPWQPGFGLDEAARSVWLPDGSRVDLSKHPMLWLLLRALVEKGGRATREELSARVWDERPYQPRRHDDRLEAAVRSLRLQIEDDPSEPSRVITTDEGYALGGVVRVLSLA